MIFYAIASERGLQISPKLLTYVNNSKETNSDFTDLSYLILNCENNLDLLFQIQYTNTAAKKLVQIMWAESSIVLGFYLFCVEGLVNVPGCWPTRKFIF
jgi:hypothetical protein